MKKKVKKATKKLVKKAPKKSVKKVAKKSPTKKGKVAFVTGITGQDGSYLANAMALLGYSTVRGSSRRGGANALRQLLDDTDGKHIVFTPDGPCGPRRQLKQGCVFVASQLGRRLLPGAFVATRAWRPKGKWTDLLIPKPFSTIYVVTGEPIAIPGDLTREQINHYITIAQQAMDRLSEQAERLLTGEQQPPTQIDNRAAA